MDEDCVFRAHVGLHVLQEALARVSQKFNNATGLGKLESAATKLAAQRRKRKSVRFGVSNEKKLAAKIACAHLKPPLLHDQLSGIKARAKKTPKPNILSHSNEGVKTAKLQLSGKTHGELQTLVRERDRAAAGMDVNADADGYGDGDEPLETADEDIGGGGDDAGDHPNGPRIRKRPRLVWTRELNRRFINAVNHLGIDNATPKIVYQLMNVEGVSRQNVASRLQKYRMIIKKNGGVMPVEDMMSLDDGPGMLQNVVRVSTLGEEQQQHAEL